MMEKKRSIKRVIGIIALVVIITFAGLIVVGVILLQSGYKIPDQTTDEEPTPELDNKSSEPQITRWELYTAYNLKPSGMYSVGFKSGETPEFTIPKDALAWKVVVEWGGIEQQRFKGMAIFWVKIAKINVGYPYFESVEAGFEECDTNGSKEVILYDTDGIYYLTAGVSNQVIYIKTYFGY